MRDPMSAETKENMDGGIRTLPPASCALGSPHSRFSVVGVVAATLPRHHLCHVMVSVAAAAAVTVVVVVVVAVAVAVGRGWARKGS